MRGKKFRPCIVLAVKLPAEVEKEFNSKIDLTSSASTLVPPSLSSKSGGKFFTVIALAFGSGKDTSVQSKPLRSTSIEIERGQHGEPILPETTRFHLDTTTNLPATEYWFLSPTEARTSRIKHMTFCGLLSAASSKKVDSALRHAINIHKARIRNDDANLIEIVFKKKRSIFCKNS